MVANSPDAHVTEYPQEDLLAMGFGAENAARSRRDDIDSSPGLMSGGLIPSGQGLLQFYVMCRARR
jgi:hypothetical protein